MATPWHGLVTLGYTCHIRANTPIPCPGVALPVRQRYYDCMAKHDLLADLGPAGHGRMRILASFSGRPEWAIEVLVLATDAGPGVLELKVRPHEGHPGRRDGGPMPRGGITTRLMRDVNVGELLDLARDCARTREATVLAVADNPAPDLPITDDFREELAAALREQAAMSGALSHRSRRPGKRGNGIDHYLTWAARYAEKVAAVPRVRNPNVVLAKEFRETPEYVRDTITDARRRYGLLTPGPGRGRAGGTLTPKALALIAERQQTEEVDENE